MSMTYISLVVGEYSTIDNGETLSLLFINLR